MTIILFYFFHFVADEEWNAEPNEDSLFLVQTSNSWHSKELSLPRARRHNSSGFESSPVTSPSSANTPPDERCIQEALYRNKKPAVRSIPSCDFERKQKYVEDVRPLKHTFFDRVASKSEIKLDKTSKKRSPEDRQRTPSPTEIVSPKERFKDAKEKFLLLERERLEEQERQLQQNIEKKKIQEFTSSVPIIKSRTSKNWKGEEDTIEVKHSNVYRQSDQQSVDDFDVNEKRKSVTRVSYHRNKSMESLNSEDYPSVVSTSYRDNENNGINLSRSKLNSFREEDRYNGSRMSRYCSPEIDQSIDVRRCKSPVNNVPPRSAHKSHSEDYLPNHIDNKRYRDVSKSQHSVPFANDDSIPLQRYRSPTRHEDTTRSSRNHSYPYQEEANQRRVKRSESKYHSKSNEVDKRRFMLNAIEDEKRRNSNEIAKEFKRRSYQDQRTGSEISYQGNNYPNMFLKQMTLL